MKNPPALIPDPPDPPDPPATEPEQPLDTRIPTLAMVADEYEGVSVGSSFLAPKHVTGSDFIGMDKPSADSKQSDDNPPQPVEDYFAVSTGGISDAETTLLAAGSWQVDQFETLKKKVLDEEKWVFLVSDPKDIEPYDHTYQAPAPGKGGWLKGGQEAGHYADYEDPDPTKTQQMIDNQRALLNATASIIKAIGGNYTALLNNAAQLYALSDENSCPPPDSTV